MARRKWYGGDSGLSIRMFLTMFLLAVLYLAFIALLFYLGIDQFLIALVAGALLFVQYFFSDKIVLMTMGAREVTASEAPQLHSMVDRLCQLGDLPKPKVAICPTNIPNAFATGRSPKHSVVAVTQGLLDQLEPQEVEAVLGHELTHVKNRDMTVITIASFFAVVAQFLVRIFMMGGMGGGFRRRGDRDNAGGAIVLALVASIVVWAVSFLLINALSRYREYAADRGSAILTGAPSLLASALLKISGTMSRIPQRDLRTIDGANAFFIIPALSGSSVMEIISTHPSLEKRLARLQKMEEEMQQL